MKNKSQQKTTITQSNSFISSPEINPNILVDSDENWLSFSTKRQAPSCISASLGRGSLVHSSMKGSKELSYGSKPEGHNSHTAG